MGREYLSCVNVKDGVSNEGCVGKSPETQDVEVYRERCVQEFWAARQAPPRGSHLHPKTVGQFPKRKAAPISDEAYRAIVREQDVLRLQIQGASANLGKATNHGPRKIIPESIVVLSS